MTHQFLLPLEQGDNPFRQPKTSHIMQDYSVGVTPNIPHSASVFSYSQSLIINGNQDVTLHPPRGMKIRILPESLPPREKIRDSAEDQRSDYTFTSGASESRTSSTCKEHVKDCNVGAADCVLQTVELSKDFTFANYHHAPGSSAFAPSTNESDEDVDQADRMFQTCSSITA